MLSSGEDSNLRYIADGVAPLFPRVQVVQSFVAHFPDREKYKQYMKPNGHAAAPLYMPFWEMHELDALREMQYPNVSRDEVGGILPILCSVQCRVAVFPIEFSPCPLCCLLQSCSLHSCDAAQMLQLISTRGEVPRDVLEKADQRFMDNSIDSAIESLNVEDIAVAAIENLTEQASHRIAKIHPPHWRDGEHTLSKSWYSVL